MTSIPWQFESSIDLEWEKRKWALFIAISMQIRAAWRSQERVWLQVKASLVRAPVRQHTSVEFYHENISTVILPFPLIQEVTIT